MYIRKTFETELQEKQERDEGFEELGALLFTGLGQQLKIQGVEATLNELDAVRNEMADSVSQQLTYDEDEQDLVPAS